MNRRDRRSAGWKHHNNTGDAGLSAPESLCAAGLRHLRAGRYLDAQICCQQALSLNPDDAGALHLMGLLSLEAKQYDHAAEWISRAIRQDPRPEYLSSLGNSLQQQGRLEEALDAHDKALQLKPDDAGSWTHRGKILVQLAHPADALQSFQQALKHDPRSWEAACQSGILLYQSGRPAEAVARFDLCDEIQPNHAPTLYMRAVFLRDLGRFEESLADARRANALDPDNADTCNNIGSDLHSLNRDEEALPWFDRALLLRPNFVGALYNKAVSLGKLERFDEAFAIYQRLRNLDLNGAVTDWNLAVLLNDLGRFDDALLHYNLSDQQRPDHVPTLSMRARCLYNLKRFEECLADNRRAHALDPTDADVCNLIGDALQLLRRYGEALPWFDRALALRPDFVSALLNKAFSLRQFHRFQECFSTYDEVKAIDRDNAIADWNLAHLHLLTGNFDAGWMMREVRWRMPLFSARYPKFSQPMWLGEEAVAGKTILIHADEGLGDTIQFARYVPMLAARGARVILVVDSALRSLLSRLPGVSECRSMTATTPLPPFDMHCPVMRLPLAFGTRLDTIPVDTPYLPSPAADRVEAWEDRLGPHDKLRVGLVWSGNPKHMNDHNRSMPLQLLLRVLDVDAVFVSLQKDPKPDDKAILRERPDIIDLTADLADFSETAALVSCLDLVITVDTSVAHLAAALGRPTWILLPYVPDWRWLLDRDDSPWYPTARLFRQTETRDYGEVLDRVRDELQALIAAERDRSAPGEKRSGPISASATTAADALCEAGFRHLRSGQYGDAQICCQQALSLNPDDADALHLMGLLSLQAQQYNHATEWIARAIRQNPKPEYISSLGKTLQRQGRYEDALKAHDKAVQLKPDDAELWKNLGDILFQLQRLPDALLGYQHAVKLDPQHWDATYRSAFVLYQMGRSEEAFEHVELCNALKPNQANALQLRGLLQRGLNRYDEYLADSLAAHELAPNDAENQNNIGDALQAFGRYEEAISWFDRALGLRPDYLFALINKGSALQRLQRFDEAESAYHRALAISPGYAEADFNLALLQLLRGDFEAGWAGREARWRIGYLAAPYPKFSQPMWLGKENIEGKTILLRIDEGLGDTIQFVRYAPMVAARGARVILVVERPLQALLSGFPGVSQCLAVSGEPLPAFDMHCPITSLPLAFGTRLDTIPSKTAYLPHPPQARVQAWQDRLGPRNKLRIGLVWSGNPKHGNDRNRSITLQTLSRLLDVDATFVSLQKDPRPADRALLAQTGIVDLTADLTDFVETAALISCLDLVITVDTSVAHLAAALGLPTWILLPYAPDFRWLLDREDCPWYPTVRLFRQTVTRDYGEVLDRVWNELQALVAADQQRPLINLNEASPSSPDALCAAGPDHMQAGRYPDAQICCEQALSANPDHADGFHLMGLQSLQSQQYDQAVEWFARAIRQDPKPEYLASLGTTLRHQGRHDDALKTFDKALQLKPADADLWQNLGEILFTLNRSADALLSFQHVLTLDPRHWGAMQNSGLLLHQQGRFEEALKHFDACNELRPDNIPTLRMCAVLLRELKRFEESLSADRQVYALNPGDLETCHNIGAALRVLGRYEEALEWFDKTLALRPNLIQALNNKASSLTQLQRFDEAFAVYDRTKELGLDNALTDWSLALLHMLIGNFEAGWAGREARWQIPSFAAKYPVFAGPKWLGAEPLDGKTILIGVDEGLGDAIQFARYLPMLAARGARVILAVQEPLCVLLSGVPGVSQCVPITLRASVPPFDFHCPMSSLPLAFATRLDAIPAKISYLPRPDQARVQAWEARLGPRNRLRVGLVWSGNPDHLNDRHRSISLRAFSHILDADAAFISLQKDVRPGDKAVLLERTDIVDLTEHLSDFTETAALVSCLDLVITVDTSVAHLAAALGCPTWILLPHTPDYRWLLDRDDSPWYPTVRLFRQTAARDYGEVLDRVRSELHGLISSDEARRSHQLAPMVNSNPAEAAPDPAESLHLSGLLCLEAKQYELALEWIARAIRQDPKPEYLSSLASVLRHLGRSEDALKTLDKAVQLKPDDAELWKDLGCVLFERSRPNDALLAFQHALRLNPRHVDIMEASGVILCQSGRLEEALGYLDRCNGLRPNHAPTLAARAVALRGLKRNEEALADNRRAHALAPDDAETCNNLGDVLTEFPGRHEEALEWFDRALQLRPGYAVALKNKGFVLTQLHRFEEAIATYRHMIALDPNDLNAEWNLSVAHMLTGNFEAGLPAREARWKTPPITYPKLVQPIWLGAAPIAGKTILIYADEGIGDSIQFARYVPMVAALGARVVLVTQEPTVTLLSGVAGVSECLPKSITVLPAFDVHCPICSLPLAFGTRLDTIPSGTSYLPRPPATGVQAWEARLDDRLGPRNGLRVGLVWSGNPVHQNDHNRSSSLRAFSKLLDADATFVSLQKDPRTDDLAVLQERPDIIDLTADLTDFVETAALLSCLDLVITVDTSVAHLAATLGLPTWILLPYVPDWRWMLDRDDSPWYPTVRLFRQTEARDYGEVLDRVRRELDARIAAGAATPDELSESGRRLLNAGRLEEARQAFERALPLKPDDAELWKDLGDTLIGLQRLDAALVSLRRALQLNPHYADAAYLIAVIFFRLGKFEEAVAHFDLCRKLQPDHALTLQLRGLSLRGLRRYEEFLADSREAHALDSSNVETRNNIGDALQFLGRYEEALQWFDRALELEPNYIAVLINKASSLQQLHRFDEAAAIYQHIKTLDPDHADADWNLSLLDMLTGNFESGWAKREARWRKTQPLSYPNISQPMWLGEEPVEGKTILVVSDEGLGDAIQFARYLPMLARRGARVAVLVQDALYPLLSAMPGVVRCFAGSAGAQLAFDMHCPMSSLPLAFKTRLDTIPAARSYLPSPAPERVRIWEGRLGGHDRLRVGLVWSGSPTHAGDHNRSVPLRMFSRLIDTVDATFVSLQKDPRPADRAELAQTDIIDLTADLTDFAETAALISCLDLVITVDTSVAHLAAALGRPTWVLLPYLPDYRWLLDRDDSPWYPTVRLFRQTETREYDSVLDRVRSALQALIARG